MDTPEPHDATNPAPALARRGLRRGAYLLPSLFTMGNILLGFYAVVLGYNDRFYSAAWWLIVAGLLDGLDGRIARMTHTESEFGKEFDSLADVLTFGAAPAYLAFIWGLHEVPTVGWLVPLYFLLCTAVRLARFNVQTKSVGSRSFVGLPSPAAAATIVSLFFLSHQLDVRDERWMKLLFLGMLMLSGSLMISTFRYPSFKNLDLKKRRSYRSILLPAVVIYVMIVLQEIFFESLALTYMASGPFVWLLAKIRRRDPASEGSETEPAEPVAT